MKNNLYRIILLVVPLWAQSSWSVLNIKPIDLSVDAQTDIQWTMKTTGQIEANDCVQIMIPNPYRDESAYQTFAGAETVSCSIDGVSAVECSTLGSTTLQIKFLETPSASVISGSTTGGQFKNPYSQRRVTRVSVTHLSQCSAEVVLAQKTTQLPGFQAAILDASQIKIESSSQQIGVKGAVMSLTLTPTTALKTQGRILIKSPAWFKKEEVGQEGVSSDFYAESLINFDAEVLSSSLIIQDYQFDFTSKTMIVDYLISESITGPIVLEVTSFNNPVDMSEVIGFQVSTADELGYMIDQSSPELPLTTRMIEPQTLSDVRLEMLGDKTGLYKGMIVTLQTFQFSISLNFPLEPFCYFVLQFPPNLKLQQNVEQVTGSGIFQPSDRSDNLNPGDFGQYQVNTFDNSIRIEGCRLSSYLTENPYGTVTINSVRMPDYIDVQPPITFKVYTDKGLSNMVVDDPTGVAIRIEDMLPGFFSVDLFRPSNFYASATKVAYTLHVRPQHSLLPESRIVIKMPELLSFNRTAGCSVILTVCDCSIDAKSNTLTLTNIFDQEFLGGTLLKFIILSATNPLGSQPAGPWSISSETPINGKFYLVDGQQYAESFFALSGTIFSSLTIDNPQVSSNQTSYDFSLKTEHNIPAQGSLKVTFPAESLLPDIIEVTGQQVTSIEGNTITFLVLNTTDSDVPITFSVKGVQNARSMRPSSAFFIQTLDSAGFIIDQGGQDIIVHCDEFAFFNSIQLENLNKTNGATMKTKLSIDVEYALMVDDTLHLELPDDISFSENVTCEASLLASKVSCQRSDRELQIKFLQVNSTKGLLVVYIYGIKNPSSFRTSLPFNKVYTSDAQGYQSQSAKSLDSLTFQTSETALIQDSLIVQDTGDYSQSGKVTIQFETVNPVGSNGLIIVKWPVSVTLFTDTYCKVTTHKLIMRQGVCEFNLAERTLKISQAFVEVPPSYFGTIQIQLSKVQNPSTNEALQSFEVTTFDDPQMLYQVDQLLIQPKLKCQWPCFSCGQQRDYCTACWADNPINFLFTQNSESTCLDQCPAGWTTNGTQPRECRQCDATCATCQDKGLAGDVSRCLTCQPKFQFFFPVDGDSGMCSIACQDGLYDIGNSQCRECGSKCYSCSGSANNCTGCNQGSSIAALFDGECIGECPDGTTEILGICERCHSPCSTCDGQQQFCSSCDGTDGLKYNFGINCYEVCPDGTVLNTEKQQCEGCRTGCKFCSDGNPEVCEVCQSDHLAFGDECVATCPVGSVITFSGEACRSLSELDARIVYYPFLILTALVAVVSCVGKVVKPHHLILSNFVIMLGVIEHVAIVVQILLTFIFGTYFMAILIIVVWLGLIGTLVAFNVLWHSKVVKNDVSFASYRLHSDNLLSTRVRSILTATASWKFQKLLYSHFFGLHVNAFKFQDQAVVKNLMRNTMLVNIGLTFVPLILLNTFGLVISGNLFKTQLQIIYLENIVLGLISIVCCLFEHKHMATVFATLDIQQDQLDQTRKALKKRRLLSQFAMIANLNSERTNFLHRKIDDLLFSFGSRRCKSYAIQEADKEQDPRVIHSFPVSPGFPQSDVERPPRPFQAAIINNCYAESFKQVGRQMKKLNGTGVNKSFQKGGKFDNDPHRSNTYIISMEEANDEYKQQRNPKQRGRKNQNSNALDNQDHLSGVILDGDAEGSYANLNMRADYLASIREEDEILKKTKIIQRKLKKETSNSTQSSPRKIKKSIESATSRISVDVSRIEQQALRPVKKTNKPQNIKPVQSSIKNELPEAELRNFNEIDILGTVERDSQGNVLINQDDEGKNIDLVGRSVNAQGYLLSPEGDVVSAHDPSQVIFSKNKLVEGCLPAPFLFERFNFNPFELLGNFKSYKFNNDVTSFVKHKTPQHIVVDDQQRQVNSCGILINAKGCLVDQQSRVVFDLWQLKDGNLPSLFTWSGSSFQITDVMGCFQMNQQNEIQLFESKKGTGFQDLGGHSVNERGYLINAVGSIVSRKGKVLFVRDDLKNGEFPKLFKFSKLEVAAVKGSFKRDDNKKPILTDESKDDQGLLCNRKGYLVDSEGNVVDRASNIQFDKHLLQDDGRLPPLFKSHKLIRADSDAELSDILQQIEDELDTNKVITISQLENSPNKERVANRTFNNQSPSRLNDDADKTVSEQGRSSASPTRSRRGSKRGYKMVKKEYMHDGDKLMASAYGGEALPRVRMVHKRFQSNVRERGQVLRDSSILSPTQMLMSQEIQRPPLVPGINLEASRTRTQLEKIDVVSAGRESNMAKSIRGFNHKNNLKKQASDQDINAAKAQDEMNKYMEQFNKQLQSMGDLSEQQSFTTFPAKNETKQLLNSPK